MWMWMWHKILQELEYKANTHFVIIMTRMNCNCGTFREGFTSIFVVTPLHCSAAETNSWIHGFVVGDCWCLFEAYGSADISDYVQYSVINRGSMMKWYCVTKDYQFLGTESAIKLFGGLLEQSCVTLCMVSTDFNL